MNTCITDFDDLIATDGWFIDKLKELKMINPAFVCTLFGIAGKLTAEFVTALPPWIEVAFHGQEHDSHMERYWSYEAFEQNLIWARNNRDLPHAYMARGYKAPWWDISKGSYEACLHHNWWVADHHKNAAQYAPYVAKGLRVYDTEALKPGYVSFHGHVRDSNDPDGNGIGQSWDRLVRFVKDHKHFITISDYLQ